MSRPQTWRASLARRQRQIERQSPADIYNDLLDEALRNTPTPSESRPLKRRRSARGDAEVIVVDDSASERSAAQRRKENGKGGRGKGKGKGKEVVVIESSTTEVDDSEDEEMEWDNVDLTGVTSLDQPADSPPVREITLSKAPGTKTTLFSFNDTSKGNSKKRTSTQPRTGIHRQIRLEAHKMHLLSLLGSFRYLNTLLSSPALFRYLRCELPPAIKNGLKSVPEFTQAQRSMAFLRGLREAVGLWASAWKETKRGWRRPRWVDPPDLGKIPAYLDLTGTISADMLMEAARTKRGSRDVGAWLFTSLLRSVGVEARLICSLQPLQFSFTNEGPRQKFYPTGSTEDMARDKSHISISSAEDIPQPSRAAPRTAKLPSSTTPVSQYPQLYNPKRRTYSPMLPSSRPVYQNPRQYIAETKTYSPNHPFFWTEAWDQASQKWIVVDPLVGRTVNQPSKIEPPPTSPEGVVGDNLLSYVMGFDSGGDAKDVTRRYAKAFHAKTWKLRVESQGGERWWNRVMNHLDRFTETLDRDQIEAIELANKVLKEPIPRSRGGFKDHPLYVLERHLKRHEMLAPGSVPVSAFTTGTGMRVKTENVYKRKDVVACHTAQQWYRRGRIIEEGEQPVKRSNGTTRKDPLFSDEEGEEEDSGTAIYSEPQTKLYIPPPVQNGIIPRNAYGNIDIYVPSMVPPGAAHVTRPSIALAAQFAGIDYADAVVGFDFARKKATARTDGIVVAEECVEGLLEVWEGMMERVLEEEERRRVARVVERWRRFMVGLGIKRRLEERHGKVDGEESEMVDDEMAVDDEEGGGFLLSETQGSTSGISERTMDMNGYYGGYQYRAAEPADPEISEEVTQHENTLPGGIETTKEADVGGGFSLDKEDSNELEMENAPNEEDIGGGFVIEEVKPAAGLENKAASSGEEDSDEGGGFIYEDEDGIL